MTDDDLKLKYAAIQEQQQLKLMRIKQQKKEKQHKPNDQNHFGVGDNLELMSDASLITSTLQEKDDSFETVKISFTNKIRSLEDENGRLKHLVKEKEVEANLLRKKWEKDKLLLEAMGNGSTNDAASTKIVELSKKIRELNSELETEKNKNRLSSRKVQELTSQIHNGSEKECEHVDENSLQIEYKALQEKYKQTEAKMSDYRNQCSMLKQELKLTQKALSNEVGDLNIQTIIKSDSNWRGRQQQILALQQKITDLKTQLDIDSDTISSAQTSRNSTAIDTMHKDQIKKMEKDRRENIQKMTEQMNSLVSERDDFKNKLDASKARNRVLSNEIKTLKSQTQTLLTKNNHDNELIQALMKQIEQLQSGLVNINQSKSLTGEKNNQLIKDLQQQADRDLNRIKQLETTIKDRDATLLSFEAEIKRLNSSNKTTGKRCMSEYNVGCVSIEASATDEIVNSARKNNSRPPSRINSSRMGRNEEDNRIINQNIHVERDKLLELIAVLQKRIKEAEERGLQFEFAFKGERKQTAMLEKEIGKLKSDGKRIIINDDDNNSLRTKIDDLENLLLIKNDEVDMLKMALDRSICAKEEDLKFYQDIMQHTKNTYLKAIKQK